MPKANNLGGFVEHVECCAVLSFREGNCKVTFPARNAQWICLSGTRYQAAHGHTARLCDLLFAWNRSSTQRLSSVLELKGGGMSVSGVVEQLQQGAQVIDGLLRGVTVTFLPVLVHRGMLPIQVNELRRRKIQFRGAQCTIELARCGERLGGLSW